MLSTVGYSIPANGDWVMGDSESPRACYRPVGVQGEHALEHRAGTGVETQPYDRFRQAFVIPRQSLVRDLSLFAIGAQTIMCLDSPVPHAFVHAGVLPLRRVSIRGRDSAPRLRAGRGRGRAHTARRVRVQSPVRVGQRPPRRFLATQPTVGSGRNLVQVRPTRRAVDSWWLPTIGRRLRLTVGVA